MATNDVRSQVQAGVTLRGGVVAYRKAVDSASEQVRQELNRVAARFQAALGRSQREMRDTERAAAAAAAALAACQENCGQLEEGVRRANAAAAAARARHERNVRANARFESAAREVQISSRSLSDQIDGNAAPAAAHLLEYVGKLQGYLNTSDPAGGTR